MMFAPPSTGFAELRNPRDQNAQRNPDQRRDQCGHSGQRDVFERQIEHLLAIRHHEMQEIHADYTSAITLDPAVRRTLPRKPAPAGSCERENSCDRKIHDQAAVFHQSDAIGQQQGLPQIVGNEDHRLLHPLLQGAKFFLHLRSRDRIERAERFVQNQNGRIGRQSPRHAHALPLASGELAGITRQQIFTRARPWPAIPARVPRLEAAASSQSVARARYCVRP